MNRGSVWWVTFDSAQGTEIRKTRPAVIISNDAANKYIPRVTIVPLTSNIKNVYPGESLVTVEGIQGKAMANQIMTADKSRLKDKMGVLSKTDLLAVENAIRVHLGL
ncbi:toxin PemK [Candidatus Termititenax dinenymphae]|uniref:mRNA interferase n=1 Tax=Candidatus Termititenax dinenymphae TaxID=2218523 RepID=A0A388TKR7_9BACT|nr:toxin PemK [Candidatus Termititenax dinenymphae]